MEKEETNEMEVAAQEDEKGKKKKTTAKISLFNSKPLYNHTKQLNWVIK